MAIDIPGQLSDIDKEIPIASLKLELDERMRQIDLLKVTVERHRLESARATAQAALIQATLERHLAHCVKDEGATQMLMAQLAESTARRKEQVAVIERRDRRIIELQQQLDRLQGNGEAHMQSSPLTSGVRDIFRRLALWSRGNQAS